MMPCIRFVLNEFYVDVLIMKIYDESVLFVYNILLNNVGIIELLSD